MKRKVIFKSFKKFIKVCKEITRRELNYEFNQKLSSTSKFLDLSDEVSYLNDVEIEYNKQGKDIEDVRQDGE